MLCDWFSDLLCNSFACRNPGIAAIMCDLRDVVWQLRREKEEEQQHVQRIQEENGELRQMIVQLEKEKD